MITKTFVPLRLGDVINASDVYMDKIYDAFTVFKPARDIDVGYVITEANLQERSLAQWYRLVNSGPSMLLNTLSN